MLRGGKRKVVMEGREERKRLKKKQLTPCKQVVNLMYCPEAAVVSHCPGAQDTLDIPEQHPQEQQADVCMSITSANKGEHTGSSDEHQQTEHTRHDMGGEEIGHEEQT